MELSSTFRVDAGLEQTWDALIDVQRVVLCLPGAALVGPEGDGYRGTVKVKVGPIKASYDGTARFARLDAAERTIVLDAAGRDSRGQGTATAVSTIVLTEEGFGTHVSVKTDLQITGKVAQFGRNVLADISDRLLAQFATNLQTDILRPATEQGEAAPSLGAAEAVDSPGQKRVRDAESLDLLGTAGPVVARQILPYVMGLIVVLICGWAIRRQDAPNQAEPPTISARKGP